MCSGQAGPVFRLDLLKSGNVENTQRRTMAQQHHCGISVKHDRVKIYNVVATSKLDKTN